MKTQKGSRFHPPRISGHQKFLRAKQANEEIENREKLRKKPLETIDLKKNNWSLK